MTTCLLAAGALPSTVIVTSRVHRILGWLYPKAGGGNYRDPGGGGNEMILPHPKGGYIMILDILMEIVILSVKSNQNKSFKPFNQA